MPRYAFTGAIEDFPAARESIEVGGSVVLAVSTNDNVLHVDVEAALPSEYDALFTLADGGA